MQSGFKVVKINLDQKLTFLLYKSYHSINFQIDDNQINTHFLWWKITQITNCVRNNVFVLNLFVCTI